MTQTAADNELGTERIGKLLRKLALPAILAQIVNVLYNIVDRMYIGNIPVIGKAALTGVGVAFPVITLISAFAALIGMGGGPLAAIRMGAKDDEGAEKIMGNCFVALLALGAVLTAVFLVFRRELLMAFGASADTIGYAESYLAIYVSGTVFVMMTLGMNNFIITQGFAKTGMATVLIGAVTNIVLDPVFIFAFDMGVQGAALATILSQAISCVWVLLFLLGKKTRLRLRAACFRPDWKQLGRVAALGLSPFIMQGTESAVQIVLNSSLQTYGGDAAVGAMTIINSVLMVLLMPLQGLGQGAQPILSYNFGACSYDRVRKTFFLLLKVSLIVAVSTWLLVMAAPQLFVMIFNRDAELMDITVWAMRLCLGTVFMMGAQMAIQQTFVSVGMAKTSIFIAMFRKVILLIPLALILPRLFGLGMTGVFLAEPIADFTSATTACILFACQSKKIFHPQKGETA